MAKTIAAGDKILLTWEGGSTQEVDEIEAVENGAAKLKRRGGFIRDDLPQWDSAKERWTYCYASAGE